MSSLIEAAQAIAQALKPPPTAMPGGTLGGAAVATQPTANTPADATIGGMVSAARVPPPPSAVLIPPTVDAYAGLPVQPVLPSAATMGSNASTPDPLAEFMRRHAATAQSTLLPRRQPDPSQQYYNDTIQGATYG